MHFEILYFLKSSIEGAWWPWSPFEYIIGATGDDADVQKADAGHSREEFLNRGPGLQPGRRYTNRPDKNKGNE